MCLRIFFQRTLAMKSLSEATVPTGGVEMLADLTKTDSLATQRGSLGQIGSALFKLTQLRMARGCTYCWALVEVS